MKTLKQKIKDKDKIIGTHINLCDISVAKIAGLSGYDFIWVDTEHSYMSFETLLGHIIAIKGTGTPVIVRAPQDDLLATKKILEMGPDGIIFPMVKNSADADRLIGNTLYPPYGTRGFGPMNAVDYGFRDSEEFCRTNHTDMCRFIQIEHKEAVDNLPDIMKNEYIDGYIIGPFDLSGSVNEICNVFGDTVTGLIKKIVGTLHENGKYVGLSTGNTTEENFRHWRELGIDMLSAGADFGFLVDKMTENKALLEKVFKQ